MAAGRRSGKNRKADLPDARDVFAADEEFCALLDGVSGRRDNGWSVWVKLLVLCNAVFVVLVMFLAWGGLFRSDGRRFLDASRPATAAAREGQTQVRQQPPAQRGPATQEPADAFSAAKSEEIGEQAPGGQAPGGQAAGEQRAVSWELAEGLYRQGRFAQAEVVYGELAERITGRRPVEQAMRDFLLLKQGLCATKAGRSQRAERIFERCLDSGSGLVRALANYNLLFGDLGSGRYLAGRMRAYRVLGLVECFGRYLPGGIERDCEFFAAEGLTREVLRLENADLEAPEALWDWQVSREVEPAGVSREQMWEFLASDVEGFEGARLGPVVQRGVDERGAVRWRVVGFESPVSEVLARLGSEGGFDVRWDESAAELGGRSVTVSLANVSRDEAVEIVAGCAGLLGRFEDEQNLTVLEAGGYVELGGHKDILRSEAEGLWQRFVVCYPGDERAVAGHFATGLLAECGGRGERSIEQYGLVARRFAGAGLAPYALLRSSKVKVGLCDYSGAEADLEELVTQYPDCGVVEQAQVHLGRARMESGGYAQAIRIFEKIYNMNRSAWARRAGALGAAECFYRQQQWPDAETWLERYVEAVGGEKVEGLGGVYCMLGRSRMRQGKFDEAVDAFERGYLLGRGSEEYIETGLGLVSAQMERGQYARALGLLGRLEQRVGLDEQGCEVLEKKAKLLRVMGLAERGIWLLRERVDYVQDKQWRGRLLLELSRCCRAAGRPESAKDTLAGILVETGEMELAGEAACELADVCLEMGEAAQARTVCEKLLQREGLSQELGRRALRLLGGAYLQQGEQEKAALALAGIRQTGDGKSAGESGT